MQTGKVNSLKNQAEIDNPGCLILEEIPRGINKHGSNSS